MVPNAESGRTTPSVVAFSTSGEVPSDGGTAADDEVVDAEIVDEEASSS